MGILPCFLQGLFCFLFSGQLVEAAFQRGAFVSSATVLTAEIFVGYCVGMLFLGLTTVVSNVFYGFGDTKITMYISMVDIGLNIVFDLVFYQFWGVAGLAYATSISAMICLGIRLFKLRKYIRIAYKPLCIEAAKILALSLTAGAAAHFALVKCEDWNVFLILIAAAAVFGLIYIVLALAFRLNTLQFVSTLLRKKLKRG